MKALTETPFFSILRKSIEISSEIVPTELTVSYDEFLITLSELTYAKIPVAGIIRQLKYAAAELIASRTIIRHYEVGEKCADPCPYF